MSTKVKEAEPKVKKTEFPDGLVDLMTSAFTAAFRDDP